MMMNCFCGMVDRRKVFSLISSRDHCQGFSPSRISDTLQAGFETVQNLSSGFVEWSCVVVITTTPRRDKQFNNNLNWVIPPNDIVLIKNVIVTLLESVKENQAVLKNARCTGGVCLKVNRIPASGYGLWGKSDFLKLSFFLKWQKYVV